MFLPGLILVGFLQNRSLQPKERPIHPELTRPASQKPCVVEVQRTVRFSVTGGRPSTLRFTIPVDYSGQAMIGLRLQADPESSLKSWMLRRSASGLNDEVEAVVEGAGALDCRSRVIVPGDEVVRTMDHRGSPWLAASTLVPSDRPACVSWAASLKGKETDRDVIAKRIEEWVAMRKASDPVFVDSSGTETFKRACLCAALFRAVAIPCRLIAYLPTSAPQGNTLSWLAEYQEEGASWHMVEPTVGLADPPRNSVVALAILSQNDEASDPENAVGVQPVGVDGQPETLRLAVQKFFPAPGGPRLMTAAYRRSVHVRASARAGKGTWFDEGEYVRELAKGPISFALYLDGRPTPPSK